MDNLVLVIAHARRCTREEAIAVAGAEVRRRVVRFQELALQVPGPCALLGLTAQETAAVERYVELMAMWMSGYHAWQTRAHRYTEAPRVVPATGPGYFDRVLGLES
ncbi:hypothetical protein [Streptomyces sp. A0592]|uniref:hypothetical protein n=1 Tax=Streptomyces sp. A0592 TaxID=2563099 RepID=UPI001445440B|nr:hypothetical protein [Streptomyces sp. A0592]